MKKQQSFLKGSLILMLSNIISKTLGAVLKIPLAYILQEEGMAIYNTALSVYTTILTFITAGIPFAASRMIASEYAQKNYSSVNKAKKITLTILFVAGLLGSFVLFSFSDFFAYSMKDPKSSLAIKVIAPSVFFVALGNVYKSYYQGVFNMVPTAISQIIESFVKLAVGLFLAYKLINTSLEYSSGGAILGITAGEIIATFILMLMYIPEKKLYKSKIDETDSKNVIVELLKIAVPMLICAIISSSLSLLDVATIRNSLLHIKFTKESCEKFLLNYSSYTNTFDNLFETMKLSVNGSRWLYGAYCGYALTIFHLPLGILATLGTTLMPVITSALTKKDNNLLHNSFALALKLTFIIALPCVVIFLLFSEDILELLFHNTASAQMLKYIAPGLIFISVSQLYTVVLHSAGHIIEPFLYGLIAAIVKIISNLVLIPIGTININGAIIGTCLGSFVMMILNIHSVKKNFNIKPELFRVILKPFLCVAIMALSMLLINNPMKVLFKNHVISILSTFLVGGVTYLLALTSLNVLNKKELKGIRP